MSFGKMGARGGFCSLGALGRVSSGGPLAFAYYVSAAGSDSNPGTQSQPWQTLGKVAAQSFLPNTTVYFNGGDTFSGTLALPASSGTAGSPIKYTSYGTGQAIIAPAASTDGITATDVSYVTIDGLTVTGSGGTAGSGILLQAVNAACSNLIVQNCTVTAMAGVGIWLSAGANAGASLDNPQIINCTANGNTTGWNASTSGIRISGGRGQQNTGANYNCTNALIQNCTANNNSGIAGTASWCGAGIFMKKVKTGTNQYNVTDNNGANCNNVSGPTGNWGAECSGVTWQYNISRNTKTASTDGGGFDLDGGCDNCIMQFNISQGNAGYGYLMYEYDDATFTSNNNNVLRFNISWNDLTGALRINSGGTHDNSGQCYNNYFKTVNTAANTIRLDKNGGAINWKISNNNIESSKAGTTNLVQTATGNPTGAVFTGNNYYTPNTLNIVWNGTTYTSIAAWRSATGQETIAAADTSKSVAPVNIGPAASTRATLSIPITQIAEPLRPDESSPILNAGVNLFTNYGINPGTVDFFGSPISTSGPWSIGIAAMKSAVKSLIFTATGAGTQTIPADFAQLYAVECIGAGGSQNGNNSGAGGGAYARITSTTTPLVAGTTVINYSVGAAVAASNGNDTWWNATSLANAVANGNAISVGAQGGRTNSAGVGGAGGAASSSVGTTTYSGGSGGNGGANFNSGGGGAAGSFGAGGNGANGGGAGTGGGGGGGANGGGNGVLGASNIGGAGGAGPYGGGGAGSLTNGTAGTSGAGGGGAGNSGGIGGAGGAGVDWIVGGVSYGAGGGGGANAANSTATNGGGAFGGGSGSRSTNPLGGNGGIRFLYKTVASL